MIKIKADVNERLSKKTKTLKNIEKDKRREAKSFRC